MLKSYHRRVGQSTIPFPARLPSRSEGAPLISRKEARFPLQADEIRGVQRGEAPAPVRSLPKGRSRHRPADEGGPTSSRNRPHRESICRLSSAPPHPSLLPPGEKGLLGQARPGRGPGRWSNEFFSILPGRLKCAVLCNIVPSVWRANHIKSRRTTPGVSLTFI